MARDSAECRRLAIVEGEILFINSFIMLNEEARKVKAAPGSGHRAIGSSGHLKAAVVRCQWSVAEGLRSPRISCNGQLTTDN